MKPVSRETRKAFYGGPEVSVSSMNTDPKDLDSQSESGEMQFVNSLEQEEQTIMTDEEIKIKALSLAINMAKLMSDITVDNVLEIAAKVAKYIKG